jgi:hypothetical protein
MDRPEPSVHVATVPRAVAPPNTARGIHLVPETHRTRRLLRLAPVLLAVAATTASFTSPQLAMAATAPKVAIIVGPTGSLTPRYIRLANDVADAARAAGARVAKAYSPKATPSNVKGAVRNANIVVYFGHGNGYPNPYTSSVNSDKNNGWGLQGPNARGTHADSWRNGTLKYYGEAWIRDRTNPAPGWVMVYGQTCYAAGSNEGWVGTASRRVARKHVAYYSRTPLRNGASAYFATNYGDQDELVRRLLRYPDRRYGRIFRSGDGFHGMDIRAAHPFAKGQVRLSKYRDWYYAFAGRPGDTPRDTWTIVD